MPLTKQTAGPRQPACAVCVQELAEKHAGELSACDAEYCEAYQRLAGAWTAKIRDLQQQLQVAEQQLLIRQEDETAALMVSPAAFLCTVSTYVQALVCVCSLELCML